MYFVRIKIQIPEMYNKGVIIHRYCYMYGELEIAAI